MTTAQQLVHAYETGLGLAPSVLDDGPDPGAGLAATLPVWALAAGSVATVTGAANRYRAALGLPAATGQLDPARIVAAFGSERLFRRDGVAPAIFAELSGFFRAGDGWVRTHANYPHHRARLLIAAGLPADADAARLTARFAAMTAAEIEETAAAADAIAVRVRTEAEWAGSAMGRAAAAGPLVTVEIDNETPQESRAAAAEANAVRAHTKAGWTDSATWRATAGQLVTADAAPRNLVAAPTDATSKRPLAGIRVLDLTRVLAGPVATRTLALLGADVLRVDPPQLPEIDWQFLDTCQGKRSTLLDLRTDPGVFADLLATADVLVTGYRPGALAAIGLDTAAYPGLIHARVSAWGESGPWGGRRGFDSIVQAASGISLLEGAPDRPGALAAQALDHGSGYLLAAGVLDALRARATDGRTRTVRVALARTASWLLAAGNRTPDHPPAAQPDPATALDHAGVVTAAPAFADYADYRWPAPEYGTTRPVWTRT
ncbi:CoA transferase [Nocardia asteroides]|uniref:CoA transferase n=1 Tax=Nocardia asteroides TaxID=1824 RepID=UPI0034397F82